MAVPTTGSGNISFFGNNASPPYDGIWSIANPGNPNDSNESLRDLLGYDWFHGPGGGNTVSFSGWGNYTGTSGTAGDSRIYGISANPSNQNQAMSIPAGLDYYYDGATYRSILNATNNLPPPGPPPPVINDVDVNVYFGNPAGAFSYMSGGGTINAAGGQSFNLDNTGSPLINNGYWYLAVSSVDPSFAGGSIDLAINGNAIFTAQPIAPGASVYFDDWTNYATIQTMASYLGAIGFVVDVTVY